MTIYDNGKVTVRLVGYDVPVTVRAELYIVARNRPGSVGAFLSSARQFGNFAPHLS